MNKLKKAVFCLLILILLLVAGGFLYLNYPLSVEVNVEEMPELTEKGVRYREDNIDIISISGSPYEMGYQHGNLMKNEINELIDFLYQEALTFNFTVDGLKERFFVRYAALSYYNHIPENYKKELQGLAEGAEVSLYDLLLINVYDELLNLAGCTNLAVWGEYSEDGSLFHGRNLDYQFADTLHQKQVLIYYRPAEGRQFVSIGFPGYVGVLTGMNEQGLTLGSMTAYAPEKSLEGMPTGILYRMIIEESSRIEEAENILHSHSRTIGNNLMITSTEDNYGTVFEISVGEVFKRPGSENSIVSTNHFNELNNETVFENSRFREQRGQELVEDVFATRVIPERDRKMNYQDMINILNDRTTGYEEGHSFNAIGNNRNIQSVVFVPENLELWVSINHSLPAAGGPFYQFILDPDEDELITGKETGVTEVF